MNDAVSAVIVSVVVGVFSLISTRKTVSVELSKIQTQEAKTKAEIETNAEGIYVANMGFIIGEFKEQVSGFKFELSAVRKEFAEFKEQHHKKIAEYDILVDTLEKYVSDRDATIEKQANKIEEQKVIIFEQENEIAKQNVIIIEQEDIIKDKKEVQEDGRNIK